MIPSMYASCDPWLYQLSPALLGCYMVADGDRLRTQEVPRMGAASINY